MFYNCGARPEGRTVELGGLHVSTLPLWDQTCSDRGRSGHHDIGDPVKVVPSLASLNGPSKTLDQAAEAHRAGRVLLLTTVCHILEM